MESFKTEIFQILRCPLCASELERKGGAFVCKGERPHCFDLSSSGYVNLLPPGKGKNAHTGDDKGMISARVEFLNRGYYAPISKAVGQVIARLSKEMGLEGIFAADSGCGEGYHTCNIVKTIAENGVAVTAVGFDASKHGAAAASKRSRRERLAFDRAAEERPFHKILTDGKCDTAPAEKNSEKTVCGDFFVENNSEKNECGAIFSENNSEKNECCAYPAKKISEEHQSKINNGSEAFFAAGNIFSLPLKDESVDFIISMFAPIAGEESLRVLKKGAYLVVAAAGQDHLFELRDALYDEPRRSSGEVKVPSGFEKTSESLLTYKVTLNSTEDILKLFEMTPFYYRTSEKDKAKLMALSSLEITVQVNICICRKSI